MPLAWTGAPKWAQDGFHEGMRVAGVQRCSVPLGGDTLVHDRYWMAFARQPDFEIVLVDGAPGRWKTDAEAREAAEQAFDAWMAESGDMAALARAVASCPPNPLSRGKVVRIGAKAALEGAMASWWPFRHHRHPRPEARTDR
jgi:hypothetical protein